MFTEDSNPAIEAIKENNLEIEDSLLKEIDDFKKAFEEDSIDEYINQNTVANPVLQRLFNNACEQMRRVNQKNNKIERRRRRRSENSNIVERTTSTKNLIQLINPYTNPDIHSFKQAKHEVQKIEKFINEEMMRKNIEIPNQGVDKTANDLSRDNVKNNIRKSPEDPKEVGHAENVEWENINNEAHKNNFNEIADRFCNNLDFSVLVSKKEAEEKIEFLDLINVFLYTNKYKLTYERLFFNLERETRKMFENMINKKRRILNLIKKGFLFNKLYTDIKVKKLKASVLGENIASGNNSEKPQDKTDRHKKVKLYCTIDNCGRVYSNKSSLNVHIKKHHLNDKYECQFCLRFFKSHQNCKDHIYKHHPEENNFKLSLARKL